MKAVITALGICALLFPPARVYATAYTWDGAYNSKWAQEISGNNWEPDFYPARSQNGDTATINVSTNANPVKLIQALDYTIATLLIDADAANASIGLRIRGTGILTSTGLITVKGYQTAAGDATLEVEASGSFSPHSMKLEGSPDTDYGDAILIFDEDVTVTDSTGVDITGLAQVRVGSDDTFDAYNLDVGDGAVHSELEMNTGTGTMLSDTLTIQAGDAANEHAEFLISSGTMTVDTNGDTDVIAHDDAVANATLTVNGANASLDPGDLYLYGGNPVGGGQAKFSLESSGSLINVDTFVFRGDSRFETRQVLTHSVVLTVEPEPETSGGADDGWRTDAVINVVDANESLTVGSVVVGGATYASKLTFTGSGSLATN